MRGVNSFRGQNPHCLCLCMCGRQVRPFCWILQYFRLRWLRGPPLCRRRGPRPLPLRWPRGTAGYWRRDCRVVRTDSRSPAACRLLMEIRHMDYSFITLGFWSSLALRSRPGSSTVHQRSGWISWARNKRWQRPSTYSEMQVSCCQICRYCHRMSFSMMALGLGQSLFPRIEVDDLSPRAARAASYMLAMGLWHPQTGPGAPGPVPVSSCRSCMSCKYCFPEDQLPPG